jgi:ABC-type phosphate transport system auxiliary subunit
MWLPCFQRRRIIKIYLSVKHYADVLGLTKRSAPFYSPDFYLLLMKALSTASYKRLTGSAPQSLQCPPFILCDELQRQLDSVEALYQQYQHQLEQTRVTIAAYNNAHRALRVSLRKRQLKTRSRRSKAVTAISG